MSGGFVRVVTHPAVLVDPLGPNAALDRIRTWLERPNVRILEPGSRSRGLPPNVWAVGVVSLLTDIGGEMVFPVLPRLLELRTLRLKLDCEPRASSTQQPGGRAVIVAVIITSSARPRER